LLPVIHCHDLICHDLLRLSSSVGVKLSGTIFLIILETGLDTHTGTSTALGKIFFARLLLHWYIFGTLDKASPHTDHIATLS
jgi:hypothetical protein